MLARVARELDHQQLPALHAASDAVGLCDVGALFFRFLQDAVHLGVGVIDELHGACRVFLMEALHAVKGLWILVRCGKKKKKT